MNKNIRKNQIIHGWKLVEKKIFKEEKSLAFRFEHVVTGAEYLHIDNDFNDKAIAIALKTCPSDHTGVAHILEHTVLTGSKKYPVRDPFFSMIKNSLQTFMNAFTAEDWTAYLFSSQYDDDLENLLSVYLDAVYYPKLDYLNFCQEGWRYEYQNNRLSYAGVVYNEMKGSMSSPDRLMNEYMKEGLFPGTLYRFNSGGRPDKIPELDFESFKDFHKTYYHPSNTLVYSFGPIDLRKTLKFINDNAFAHFEKKKIDSDVKKEKRFASPKKLVEYFPSSNSKTKESQFLSAWLVNPAVNIRESLLLELISNLLIGEASAPLKKAMLQSGLGSDMADGSGVTADYKDVIFACGLKGVKKEDVSKVKSLINKELKKICQNGFDAQDTKAVLNKLEFKYREVKNQPYPYGIKLFIDIITPWRHGGKVMDYISWSEHFDYLRNKVKTKGYIERNIKKLIINNKHRLNLELHPDTSLFARQLKEETDILAKYENELSRADKNKIIQENKELDVLQKSKEDLSCLPELALKSIPKKVQVTEPSLVERNITVYAKKTKGFVYASLAFPLGTLSEEEMLLLPLLSYALPQIGSKEKNYQEFIRQVNTYTGGIKFFPWAEIAKDKKIKTYLFAKGKALNREWFKLLELLSDLLSEADFSNSERIFQYAQELEAKISASVVSEGHYYAMSLSARSLTQTKELQEAWHGLRQRNFLKNIIKNKNKKELTTELSLLAEKVFKFSQAQISVTSEKEKINPFVKSLKKTLKTLEQKKSTSDVPLSGTKKAKFRVRKYFEAYSTNTAASFVAMSARAIDFYHPDSVALMAAVKLLSRNQIHNLVREQGGAYGGFATYDYYSALIQFGSYRDPHLRRTLHAFKEAINALINEGVSQESLKSAQLMLIADMGKPLTPAEAGAQAFYHRLIGLDTDARQKFRNEILKLKEEDIIIAAKKYLLLATSNSSVAVISNREKIEEANRARGEKRLEVKEI